MTSREPAWQPTDEHVLAALVEQNPWHPSGVIPEELAHPFERSLANHLWQRLLHDEPRRFQFIIGPRRVGKTTTMYQTVRALLKEGIAPKRVQWFRMDHPMFLTRAGLDSLVHDATLEAEATPERPAFIFLDELTYAKDWDLWLKTFYDDHWPVRIVATSSSTAALRNRRLESGVGRWDEQYMGPCLFDEYLELLGKPVPLALGETLFDTLDARHEPAIPSTELAESLRRYLLTGGFPELLLSSRAAEVDEETLLLRSQRILRSDAVERAIYKDIPQAFGVDKPQMLERLLYTLAGQTCGILSPQSICRTLDGMSQPTFDRYLTYLERAFLVFTLPNYSGNESTVQKRGRKLYFVDGAVRNAALQRGIAPLTDPMEMGVLLENAVAGHLHSLGQQTQTRLYHWRDKEAEVDLVFDHASKPVAIEVGSSLKHSREGMVEFQRRYPRFKNRCWLAVPGATARPHGADGIAVVPMNTLLLAISALSKREMGERLRPMNSPASSPRVRS